MTLTAQIALASAIVALSVLLHLVGLAALLAVLRRHRPATRPMAAFILDGAAILLAAFGLFAQFEQALYFSTSTYVTIGYGDVVLPPGSRILGSIEGASGIILIGWSTAFFFAIVDRLKLLERGLEREREN